MEIEKIFVLFSELVGWYVDHGAIEIIDAVEEVLGEALEGEVAGGGDLALRLVLQVAVVGYCAF